MRNIFNALLISAALLACGGQESEVSTDLINNPNTAAEEGNSDAMPEIKFEEDSYDFGDISQGERVEHVFTFENKGKSDLIISSAVGSCGCTVPTYPKEPIKPGEKGEVQVVFDSNGKKGAQHKRVTIVANTNPNKTMIAIMANVLVPEKTEE